MTEHKVNTSSGPRPAVTRPAGRIRYRTAVAVAAAAALAAAAVAGCSGDSGKSPSGKASATPASRICDGTLDSAATAALERMGGTKEFEEPSGTTSGHSNHFSVSRAAAHLHDGIYARSRCTVYVPGAKSPAPLIEIDFRAVDYDLDPADTDSDKDKDFYPMARYASTDSSGSAELLFTCATTSGKGTSAKEKTRYVKADMYGSGSQIQPESTPKDRMVVLTSVSRHLAAELGCTDEAELPAAVPDAAPVRASDG